MAIDSIFLSIVIHFEITVTIGSSGNILYINIINVHFSPRRRGCTLFSYKIIFLGINTEKSL